jgi:hypothetical protein
MSVDHEQLLDNSSSNLLRGIISFLHSNPYILNPQTVTGHYQSESFLCSLVLPSVVRFI